MRTITHIRVINNNITLCITTKPHSLTKTLCSIINACESTCVYYHLEWSWWYDEGSQVPCINDFRSKINKRLVYQLMHAHHVYVLITNV